MFGIQGRLPAPTILGLASIMLIAAAASTVNALAAPSASPLKSARGPVGVAAVTASSTAVNPIIGEWQNSSRSVVIGQTAPNTYTATLISPWKLTGLKCTVPAGTALDTIYTQASSLVFTTYLYSPNCVSEAIVFSGASVDGNTMFLGPQERLPLTRVALSVTTASLR
jgi:hypothetical protein